MNFVFQKMPKNTSTPDFNSLNPWGKPARKRESNFDGGDPGLQYRFWNMAENGYAGSDIDNSDSEVLAEEAAFLGLENLFACRKQCKADQGGYPSLRQCIRACKGKGPTQSALKAKDLEIQNKMAESLTQSNNAPPVAGGSSKTTMLMWVIVSIVALIIIGLIIYFLTRKKEAPAVAV
jgi:hypothetical protein